MSEEFSSAVLDVEDAFEANELFQARGWTDGLPIVPPTKEALREFLSAAGLSAGDLIASEPIRRRIITAEKVCLAGIMAGCLPDYMPVVVSALRAMSEPQFSLHGSTASTGGCAPMLVVNGPLRRQLQMNATHNLLANGCRANASIGRAIRLVIINVLGGLPGQFDRATLGHAGKFTFCFAEDEEDSRWIPLAVERGIEAGRAAVTVMSAGSPHQVMHEWSQDPKDVLQTYAASIRANMLTYSPRAGHYAMIVPKQHRQVFDAAGWQKRDIREYLFEQVRFVRAEFGRVGKASLAAAGDAEEVLCAFRSPDDLLVIAAGGPAGGFGMVVPPWAGDKSEAVTRAIDGGLAAAQRSAG